MLTPLISIITINFNNRDGLSKTIKSVVSQTACNYEYIIIDGASTDGSTDVIKENQAHLAFWVSEKDSGIYEAMNKGIAVAKGEYLLFLNSGDYLSSTGVIKQAAENFTGQDIVYGNLYQDVRGRLVETIYPSKISAKYFFTNSLPHPASFIKKELFEKYGGYNTGYKIVSDWEFFFLMVCKYNRSIKHINVFISVYNLIGLSHNSGSLPAQERKRVIGSHFQHLENHYKRILKIEKVVLAPYKLMKKGYRFLLRLIKINRVYIKDI